MEGKTRELYKNSEPKSLHPSGFGYLLSSLSRVQPTETALPSLQLVIPQGLMCHVM